MEDDVVVIDDDRDATLEVQTNFVSSQIYNVVTMITNERRRHSHKETPLVSAKRSRHSH